jgi:hypothetical protein
MIRSARIDAAAGLAWARAALTRSAAVASWLLPAAPGAVDASSRARAPRSAVPDTRTSVRGLALLAATVLGAAGGVAHAATTPPPDTKPPSEEAENKDRAARAPPAAPPATAPVEPAPAPPPEPAPQEENARKPWTPRPQADFLKRHTDIRLRLGFNGYTPGPFSLFTAFAGWQELGLVVEHGAASWRGFTIGVGAEAHYGQAWLLGALTQRIANYDDYQFRWKMWDAAGSARVAFHWTELRGVDPYLLGAVGAGLFHLDSRVRDWPLDTMERVNNPYLRIEAGGGLLWWIPGSSRFIVGAEARYLVTVQIDPRRALDMSWQGEQATFALFPQHKPPKGFSWVASVGVRF